MRDVNGRTAEIDHSLSYSDGFVKHVERLCFLLNILDFGLIGFKTLHLNVAS